MSPGVYFIHSAALPDVYLSPCAYVSPALIRINMVCVKYHLPSTIINIQKYKFSLFEALYLRKENRCLHAILHNSIAIHSPSIHQLLNGQLDELPIILDQFFNAAANITSLSVQWKGRQWVGATKWQAKVMPTLKIVTRHLLVSFSSSHIAQNS